MKGSDAGVRVRFAWGETVRVTATVCGLLPASAEVSVMAPEYVPAASPAGLTETTSVAGVVALAGETLSQLPPELVDGAAAKESAAPVLETETLCAAGDGDPIWCVKVNDAGVTIRFGPVDSLIFVTKAS